MGNSPKDWSKGSQAETGNLYVQALAAFGAGDIGRAERLCEAFRVADPSHAHNLNLLAAVRQGQGRVDDALELAKMAVGYAEDDPIILSGYADILNKADKFERALQVVDEALKFKPEFPEALINRGIALTGLYRFAEGRRSFLAALELNAQLEDLVKCNLALLHAEEGAYETSRKYYEAVCENRPDEYSYAHTQQRLGMYTPSTTRADELRNASLYWATKPYLKDRVGSPKPNDLSNGKRLKVGYFSTDFKAHPVSKFLKPVLEHHDRNRFEIVFYDTTPDPDEFSQSVRELADTYHCGLEEADADLADQIRSDQVDILVDLTGLFKDNRLLTLRYRPAPIQVSWIGYSGTTAMPEMDYIMGDANVCPSGTEADFTEDIVRLPNSYLCYAIPARAKISPRLPKHPTEPIVFGSFNNHVKLNHAVIGAWSEILKRVPNSMLYLKTQRFDDSRLRQHVRRLFEARGILGDRLITQGAVSEAEHFSAYNKVDIALDPFPYCGTTTTAEALSMGVPLITLVGDRWVQRTSYGFLRNIGLADLAVATVPEYIELATKLASDPVGLERLRGRIKESFQNSPICDPVSFTRHVEDAFRQMWTRYCRQNSGL